MLLKANSKCTQNISEKKHAKRMGVLKRGFLWKIDCLNPRSLESPDWKTPVISFDEKYPVGKRMNASVMFGLPKFFLFILGVAPQQ